MSANEQIGKLQGLLERVQLRAQARGQATLHGNGVTSTRAAAPASVELDTIPPAHASAHPAAQASAYPAAHVSAHPAAHVSAHPAAQASAHPSAYPGDSGYDDSDVEVSSEEVEVDIDIDEPMAMESGAQPVAQATMPPEDLLEEEAEVPAMTHASGHPSEEPEAPAPALANEIEEPAPSSSRRPIAEEEPAAYAEESAPRHTPPPESGRQVAAAPSAHPPSRRPSTTPSVGPDSMPDHTLIGGWREPGLGAPHISPRASTGVRVPAPPVEQLAAVAPQPSGTRLSPDVTRPELAAAGTEVATFAGAPAIPRPTTLGELLDLTLGL